MAVVPGEKQRSSAAEVRSSEPRDAGALFLPIDETVAAAPRPRAQRVLALVTFGCALAVIALTRSLLWRTLLPLLLTGFAFALWFRKPRPHRRASARRVALKSSGLTYRSETEETELLSLRASLAGMSQTFGMTLLSNRRRDRVVLAVTSPSGSFLIGARFDFSQRRSAHTFLSRATVISNDEAALDAIGPDGLPLEISSEQLQLLHAALERLDPNASGRLVLTDPRGAPIRLDGNALEVAGRVFDLSSPLEWRPILFQEPFFQDTFGATFARFQGTWIKQGALEVVLVSLLPPSVLDPSPHDFESTGSPELDLPAMRDQRLSQAIGTDPPPLHVRVAVDGLFMLPLRVALSEAPRTIKSPSSRQLRITG